MSVQQVLNDKRKFVSNKEITTGKWKINSILRVVIGIVYGVFFGLIPTSIAFTDASVLTTSEISALVGLLSIGTLSLSIIFWLFRGDIRKRHVITYSIVHIINALLLVAGILATTILYPSLRDLNRYFVMGAAYLGWAIIMSIVSIVVMSMFRKQYPLIWSRVPFVVLSIIVAGAVEPLIYIATRAKMTTGLDSEFYVYLLGALAALVLSITIFGFGIAFIKRYRDVLLGDRTEYEIDTIHDWESSRIFALVAAAASIITYSGALFFNNKDVISMYSIPFYVAIAIDVVLVVPYVVLISYMKAKNSNKAFYFSRIFKSIDNGLMLDVFAWIIVAKATLLQGIYLHDNALSDKIRIIILLSAFISIIILYGFSTIISFNVPNLRNTAVTIPTLGFALVLALFVILFGGYLQKDKLVSNYVFLFMPLIVLMGMSTSLIIKIGIIAKIFKTDWYYFDSAEAKKEYDSLLKEQQEQEQMIDDEIEVATELEAEEINVTK